MELWDHLRSRTMKLVFVGNPDVGKTCLVRRLVEGTFRTEKSPGPISYELGEVLGHKLHLWDIAGDQRHRHFVPMYTQHRDMTAMLLVFDLTVRATYDALATEWLPLVPPPPTDSCGGRLVYIVGTKMDLKEQRVVSDEEAVLFATSHRARYFEVSSKTGEGVRHNFDALVKLAEVRIATDDEPDDFAGVAEPILYTQQQQKRGCCITM